MITQEQIQTYVDDVVRKFDPEKVILFGSYAYGTPRTDSDLDLLVMLPFEGNSIDKSVEILLATRPRFSIDLLARTAQAIDYRLEIGDFFMQDVMSKGKILYEKIY